MRLSDEEVEELLTLDVPAHLGTIDPRGFPSITPIWFLWEDGALYMTSVEGRPQLRDLARDSRASICIDIEERVSAQGIRHNRQVRARGKAELFPDPDGYWTRLITRKYVRGQEGGEAKANKRASMPRVVIKLVPDELVGLGTPPSQPT